MPSRDAIFRGFAKWPTASRFDRDIRTFESSTLCHFIFRISPGGNGNWYTKRLKTPCFCEFESRLGDHFCGPGRVA